MSSRPTPTGREVFLDPSELIVSKTDLTGKITYANHTFLKLSRYTEDELLGAPHSILRHPDMPRCVFKYLWDTLESGQEVFAYVINLNKDGDFYWVFAHVTPTFDDKGKIIGYHSNRRAPEPNAVAQIAGIYSALLSEESKHADKASATEAGLGLLVKTLGSVGKTYPEFVFSL